ncbi:MAG: DUF2490 domain-containing protein [Bacteroidales bacterium]|nr:DUF2490 domain-containing protein [Bacteroidales bacterium]
MVFAVAALFTLPAAAQNDGDIRNIALSSPGIGDGLTYSSVNNSLDFGAWISGGIDWDIIPKQLTLSVDEQIRIKDQFSNPNKSYSNVGVSYRILPWLKAGAHYSLAMTKNNSGEWRTRHRGAVSLSASARLGCIKLTLREKFQATYKAYDVNLYQSPQTDLALKSRLKLEYDLFHSKWTPYISAEIRNTLNAVNSTSFEYGTYTWQKYDASTNSWENKTRTCYGNLTPSYNDIYINRLRFNLGTEWKFARNQSLDMYLIFDYNMDMPVDFSSSGIQKSYGSYTTEATGSIVSESNYYKYGVGILTLEDSCFFGIGLAYRFKL